VQQGHGQLLQLQEQGIAALPGAYAAVGLAGQAAGRPKAPGSLAGALEGLAVLEAPGGERAYPPYIVLAIELVIAAALEGANADVSFLFGHGGNAFPKGRRWPGTGQRAGGSKGLCLQAVFAMVWLCDVSG